MFCKNRLSTSFLIGFTMIYRQHLEDVFYCVAKWKANCPELPLYLMSLGGNDVLERLFGNIRLKIWLLCCVDNLQLINSVRAMEECSDILRKHPEWSKKSKKCYEKVMLGLFKPWTME